MLALTAGLGVATLRSISTLSAELENATQKTCRRLELSGRMDTAGSNMLAAMRGLVLFSYAKSAEREQFCRRQFDDAAASWQKSLDEFRPMIVTEEGRRIVASLQDELTQWRAVVMDVEQSIDRGDTALALKIDIEKGLPIYQANTRDTHRLAEIQDQMLTAQRERSRSLYTSSYATVLILLMLAIAAGAVVLIVTAQTSRVLRQTAAELQHASGQLVGAASQISSSGQSLAQGASEQAASLQETSASAEQVSSMTRKNEESTRSAAALMSQTNDAVTQANATLTQMEATMAEINASSEKIARIIKTSDEIAFQTNILALNAAVEAARAGEAGLGFAVVADEVRNLAQRSAQAARDTAGMIEESIARAGDGKSKLNQVSEAIRGITERAATVQTLIQEVHHSSERETIGVTEISKAVTQVEQVTQHTAAAAEQTASAGEELNSQASALTAIVDRLEQLVGASHA